ncbi:MAG TPA: translation elongation factor Ts, partial [Chromatiales bacterium]|nr:translation elongation factor Ts [Chromatiales bacterium]
MAITAAMVKELRERTGAGMMECKKALVETDGDIDAAIEQMRKSGMAKADKKAGRTAAEGLVAIRLSDDDKTAAIVEVNCETDFVTKGEDFRNFVDAVARRVLDKQPANLEALLALSISDDDATSVEDTRKALIARIGENMNVRRFELIKAKGRLATYMHGNRIG